MLGTSSLQWRDNAGSTSGIGTQITGQTGTVDSSLSHQNSAFKYDESDATAGNDINHKSKWDSIDGNTNLINAKGYRVFIRGDRSISLFTNNNTNNATKLWVRGTNPSSSISVPLTYTPSAAIGWNLIGNPYACTLDWDEISAQGAGSFNAIDNAIYIWNPLNTNLAGGGYTSYVNGVGSGTPYIGTPYISSWQGFFVKANGASPLLTIKESHKISNQAGGAFFKKGIEKANCLQLKLSDETKQIDDIAIYFEAGASNNFDSKYDAIDLTEALGIGTESKKEVLSISGLPTLIDSAIVSLNMALNSGKYKLSIANLSSFQYMPEIFLIDHFLNTKTKWNKLDTISFTVDNSNPSTFGSNRFELLFGKNTTGIENLNKQAGKFTLLGNPVNENLELEMQNIIHSYYYKIIAIDGKEWMKGENKINQNSINVQHLPTGIFILTLQNENFFQAIKFIKNN